MDETNYITEHQKGQHLLSEERHEIEVRYCNLRSNKNKKVVTDISACANNL